MTAELFKLREPHNRSGRSTRMVEHAMRLASEGRDVYIISREWQMFGSRETKTDVYFLEWYESGQRRAAEATVGYVENPIQAEVQVSAHTANDIRCKINGLRLSDVIS